MMTHTWCAVSILLLCTVASVHAASGDEWEDPKAGGFGGDKVSVAVNGNGNGNGQAKRAAKSVSLSDGCNKWLTTGNVNALGPQQATIPILLSFTEHLNSSTLRALSPACDASQASNPACAASLAAAAAASNIIANLRLNKVVKYLNKLKVSPTVQQSQILGQFSIANIVQIVMSQSQVNSLINNFMNGVVNVEDSDYLELKAVEYAQEVTWNGNQQAPGACTVPTGSSLYSYTSPKVSRLATTADSFYNTSAVPTQTRVAVIDQGLNVNHTLVKSNLGVWGDCSMTSSTCVGSVCSGNCCRRHVGNNSALDTCSNYGSPQGTTTSNQHGTACVGAVAGNAGCTTDYRGGANVVVDFFRAYYTVDFINAFQAAVTTGDKIISTSLGVNSTAEASSSVSLAADSAFDAGVITFAAAGNYGCSWTYNGGCTTSWGYTTAGTCTTPNAKSILAPANAHKAMAVGAYSAAMMASSTGATLASIGVKAASLRGSITPMCYSSRGPTKNGRVKPDIMGPTGIDTAFTPTSTSTTNLAYFSGTSAATPNVAGAFASFYNYRRNNQGTQGMPSTGQFMASIIAAGENYGVPTNNIGAGSYRPGLIYQNGTVHNSSSTTIIKNAWSTFTLAAVNATATMSGMTVTDTARTFRCAAWWPASATALTLSDIDLQLTGPTGAVVATSTLKNTVWEKVALLTTPAVGSYQLTARLVSLTGVNQALHMFCFY